MFFICLFFKLIFRERGRKREREKHQYFLYVPHNLWCTRAGGSGQARARAVTLMSSSLITITVIVAGIIVAVINKSIKSS